MLRIGATTPAFGAMGFLHSAFPKRKFSCELGCKIRLIASFYVFVHDNGVAC